MERPHAGRGSPARRSVEAHRARALAVDLDHEAPEVPGLGRRALDLGEDRLAVAGADRAEERLHVLVRGQPDEEVGVGSLGPADPDLVRHARAAARRPRSPPAPSATPARIRSAPRTSLASMLSSKMSAP